MGYGPSRLSLRACALLCISRLAPLTGVFYPLIYHDPQLAAYNLAGCGHGQFFHEEDFAWVLVSRQSLLHMLLDLELERIASCSAVLQHHNGNDDFGALGIRRAH